MRKNNLINLMVGAAMLLTMSFGLSSCEDILGEWDKPAPIHVSIDGTTEVTITNTETGASATVNVPSDITKLLNTVKEDITAKGTEEYVFDITNSGVKSTSGDNTVYVPKVVGSNINLKFEEGVNTESPLVIRAAETASATPTTAVNTLTITMPDGTTGLNLVIDMPETSVTVKTVSGSVIYEGIVANTATNTLILESGVTVKSLILDGGNVIVKNGAAIECLGAYTDNNASFYVTTSETRLRKPSGDDYAYYGVYDENGNFYTPKSVKVAKGSGDYLYVNVSYDDVYGSPFEKFTIEDGAAARCNWSAPAAKIIEGEGSATLYLGTFNYQSDETVYYYGSVSQCTETIKNLIIAPFVEEANADLKNNNELNIVLSGEKTTSESECSFVNCSFSANTKFGIQSQYSKVKRDSEGNVVTQEVIRYYYRYYYGEGEDEYWTSWEYSLDWIPDNLSNNKLDGPGKGGYWIETGEEPVYEEIEYSDFTGILSFLNSTIGGVAISADTELLRYVYSREGVTFYIRIDGTLYKVEWDEENGKYVLIPA